MSGKDIFILLIGLGVSLVIFLSVIHVLTPTNPIVKVATEVACEEMGDQACEEIKELEGEVVTPKQ